MLAGCAADYGTSQSAQVTGDINPAVIVGTLNSTDELEGECGQNYTIVETDEELEPFVDKRVKVEAVVLETGGQPDIKIKSIEENPVSHPTKTGGMRLSDGRMPENRILAISRQRNSLALNDPIRIIWAGLFFS